MNRSCGRFAVFFLVTLIVGDLGTVNSHPVKNHRTRLENSRKMAAASTSAVVMPVLFSSTYLGGPGFEITWACAADKSGNVYIAGDAQSADFPVTANALQTKYGDGGQDGFVAKYDRAGNLLWSTYLGGSGWDGVFGLAVDANGNAVVTGVTESSDFPITANAVQSTVTGDAAFVTVIGADPHQYIINLTAVTTGQTVNVSVSNITDSAGNVIGSLSIPMQVLVGDTNADRFTDEIDVSQTK